MSTTGRERGLPEPTRARYDAEREASGAFFIGSPQTVADKIVALAEAVGGLSRFTMQMTNAIMAPETMHNAIELLGRKVKPLVHSMAGGT
jgi:alkanesulfonate monooxygenase SsuD/methylene tetrahydromethanopterin reductase-like flavin-dependent oxidoreductase (luciferase family)